MRRMNANIPMNKEFKVSIKVIPHKEQRCPITAQWSYTSEGGVDITVSRMGDVRYEMLLALHELSEAISCTFASGMTDEETDAFDEEFLSKRRAGRLPPELEEPGFDPRCPYGPAHHIATGTELVHCAALGVNWAEYEKRAREVSWEGKEFSF
jgi:hypothetical protein